MNDLTSSSSPDDARDDAQDATRKVRKARVRKPSTPKAHKEFKNDAGVAYVTIAQIARELNIAPKIARAKMRRNEAKVDKAMRVNNSRHEYKATYRKALVAFLSNGR